MSLLKSIANLGRSILSSPATKVLAPMIPGIGTAVAAASTAYGVYSALKTPSVGSVMPGSGSVMTSANLGSLNAGMMGLSPQAIGRGAAVLVKGARAIPRAAVNLCRKYPQWCSTIGGTVAVEALFHSGQLPVPKHRRGRGITAHELRAFKRVARFTSKYCAPVHKAMRSPAVRHRRASCQ